MLWDSIPFLAAGQPAWLCWPLQHLQYTPLKAVTPLVQQSAWRSPPLRHTLTLPSNIHRQNLDSSLNMTFPPTCSGSMVGVADTSSNMPNGEVRSCLFDQRSVFHNVTLPENLKQLTVPQCCKGNEPVFLGCLLPVILCGLSWISTVSQSLALSSAIVPDLTPHNAATLFCRTLLRRLYSDWTNVAC